MTKSYSDCIYKIAKGMFNDYMGGGYAQAHGVDMVAFVFEKIATNVRADIEARFKDMKEQYYKIRKMP